MNMWQRQDLLNLLKTLADEQRLTMLGYMSEGERTVSEMATLLELTEPTISHHVSKMHAAGLLMLRMAGNQRFYRLNPIRIKQFKAYVTNIDSMPVKAPVEEADETWIDVLDWSEADKKVLREYTFNGHITRFPAKQSKWQVLLRWLATKFEPDVRYTEKQVSAILREIHHDYASMRRGLVEYGYMRRERGGGDYWLTPEEEAERERA